MERRVSMVMAVLVLLFVGVAQVQAAPSVLLPGFQLSAGQNLLEGQYEFIMQEDCNLVLYRSGTPTWASGTYHKGSSCSFVMQNDGNAVIYTGDGTPVFHTNTASSDTHYIILQCDGNVVLYNTDGQPRWATNTGTVAVDIAAGKSAVRRIDVMDKMPKQPIDGMKLPSTGVLVAADLKQAV